MKGWLRRNRTWVLIGAVVLVLSGLIAFLSDDPTSRTADLDPDNPGRNGAQAVARVLADHGVEVTVARGAGALERLSIDPGTTVLVTSTDQLGRSTVARLRDHAPYSRIIVVEPSPGVVRAFRLDLSRQVLQLDGKVFADCRDDLLGDLRLEVDRAVAYSGAASSCFPAADGALFAQPYPDLAVLGAGDVLSNHEILRADNAAVALRLLGRSHDLVWYVPDAADLPADDAVSLSTLLPDWIEPGLWLGGVAVVALVLWRGRRLGRLVTEPLPVAVKAIETTESRGRLYRKVNDRAHAAGVLRTAARSSLAAQLHLPRRLAERPDDLAAEVARVAGRQRDAVLALIGPHSPHPGNDRELITLAQELAELEREVSLHR